MRMSFRLASLVLLCQTLLTAHGHAAESTSESVDFKRDILPILETHCLDCHNRDDREGGLWFSGPKDLLRLNDSGLPAVVTGKAAESELIRRITVGGDEQMPPEGDPLSKTEVEKLKRWIDAGIPWPEELIVRERHWAYERPQQAPLPTVSRPEWAKNAIDHFVLAKLDEAGMQPSPETDRARLVRRVYLDLIGIPPSPQDVDAFLADDSPKAYERVVDRLLASPQYGERWARPWLDLARYADSNGFQADQFRSMWAFRDWVIKAINKDMPYDQFTIEQLAGDLLPNATLDQQIATGFHRCTTCNVEAGVDPEENRVNQIVDRVNTTGTVWLGTSLECAQCHNHKYDPFTMRDYYQLFSFFNQTPLEVKLTSGVTYDFYGPTMELPLTPEQQQQRAELQDQRTVAEKLLNERHAELTKTQTQWETKVVQSLGSQPEWHVLTPADFKSEAGATHTVLADQSVLVGGKLDENDAYAITARTELTGVTGFKLRALLDDSLPGKGPGRQTKSDRANFVLTEFRVKACPCEDDSVDATQVGLHSAKADLEPARYEPSTAIDGNDKTGWSIHTEIHKPHEITFLTSEPIGFEAGTRLQFELDFKLGDKRSLGRFQLVAMTGDPTGDALPKDVLAAFKKAPEERTRKEKQRLVRYRREQDAEAVKRAADVDAVSKKLNQVKPETTLVMIEQEEARSTNIMKRGEFLNKGPEVQSGTPEILHALSPSLPRNRLGMAKWLVDPQNPLVARVTVNRWWAEIFGQGIVATLEDFGTQGEAPTHPELLDWLAVDFVENGWSMKHAHRVMVMSATYRQSSQITPMHLERDPKNKLLGRSSRVRLPAETIRDNALAASGLLEKKMFGQPVYPPQPNGVWRHVGRNAPKYNTSTGVDRFRRGIYTVWRRSAPYASFVNFDATDRGACTVRRSRTNTPLQALNLLNDQAYVELAFG
ncbi:MAG: PSD1 and planctomycete cytochrome C domain-containing protein, partial [Planctomycetota bacterium]